MGGERTKVQGLTGALRGLNPDAEATTYPEVPDADGGHLPLGESVASFAEPCPGDDARFLARTTVTLGELVSRACDPSVIRNLANALRNEADAMESNSADH